MELLERLKKGDQEAMNDWVRAELPRVYNLCLRLCRNQDDASDLCQDAFVRATQAIKKFRGDSSFSTWLYRITVNTWKNKVRSEKRRHKSSHFSLSATPKDNDDAPDINIHDPKQIKPEDQLEMDESHQDILTSLDLLEEEEKSIVVLRDIQEFSYEEMAEILNMNLGTVKSRLSRARNKLREVHKRRRGMLT